MHSWGLCYLIYGISCEYVTNNSVIRTQKETIMYYLNKYIKEKNSQLMQMLSKNFSIHITFQTQTYVVYLFILCLNWNNLFFLHLIKH